MASLEDHTQAYSISRNIQDFIETVLESVVELLLDRGAEVNVRDNGRVTPLHDAAMSSSNPKVIKLLLDYGADSKARESDGHTACELLQYNDVLKGHTLSEVRDWLCR